MPHSEWRDVVCARSKHSYKFNFYFEMIFSVLFREPRVAVVCHGPSLGFFSSHFYFRYSVRLIFYFILSCAACVFFSAFVFSLVSFIVHAIWALRRQPDNGQRWCAWTKQPEAPWPIPFRVPSLCAYVCVHQTDLLLYENESCAKVYVK